ncbi:MAG TPA: hypothetical protein VL588_02450 [Bdellovibrionota bacterium]|nr:hypothetical protein [Bdellovibrionota bacterium]
MFSCLQAAALEAHASVDIALFTEGGATEAISQTPSDPLPLETEPLRAALRELLVMCAQGLPAAAEGLTVRLSRHPVTGAARVEIRTPAEDPALVEQARVLALPFGAEVESASLPGKGCRLRLSFKVA